MRADEALTALGLCGHIGKGVLVSGLKMRRNFLHRQLTGRSVAAENIHVVVDVADRANRRVVPASAFTAFGANSFTPFFMRKLLHNGNDVLKGCTVASPPLQLFRTALVLVHLNHVAMLEPLTLGLCVRRCASILDHFYFHHWMNFPSC